MESDLIKASDEVGLNVLGWMLRVGQAQLASYSGLGLITLPVLTQRMWQPSTYVQQAGRDDPSSKSSDRLQAIYCTSRLDYL